MAPTQYLVEVESPSQSHGFLGFAARHVRVPAVKPGMHLYASAQQPDGTHELHRVMEDSPKIPVAIDKCSQFYHVSLNSHRFSPAFPSVKTDENGHQWDCRISGQISVTDSRRFLKSFAINAATCNAPLSASLTESWITSRISSDVQDSVREFTIDELKNRQALKIPKWEQKIAGWLDEFGLDVRVDDVSWSSAEGELTETEAKRERKLERITAARQKERDTEIREAEAKAEYEDRKEQIENDRKLSDQERGHKLQLLEKGRRKELIDADREIENARMEAEIASLEHTHIVALMQKDAESVEHVEDRLRNVEKNHEATVQLLSNLNTVLEKLSDLPDNMLAKLSDRDADRAHLAAERIVSPEFGISAAALHGLGFCVDRQNLVQNLREKATGDVNPVAIRKMELVTRDIGTARVKALGVNTSLQFEFKTCKSGYLTLLNIGTSGAVYVHVPNAYIPIDRTIVDSDRKYQIPGPELLPWERLKEMGLDYLEIGPPGWEHIAVFVSDRPILNERILASVSPGIPFKKLNGDEVYGMIDTLHAEPLDSWAVGVLSFLVE